MGHMNVMWYVGKFDEATWHLMSHLGLTAAFLRANSRGMVAVEQTIQYRRELVAGDVVSIRSSVLEIKEKSIRFQHEMRNEETDAVAATTTLVGVHLDTTSRRACALPPLVSARAKELTAA
jgi:acyl-CoA thioester hydrolase